MIKRVDHIGIAVKSIQETLDFYRGALGLDLAHTEVEPEQRVLVAFLPAGEAEVELLEPVDEEGPVSRFLAKRGPGIHHICFEVENIDEVLRRLAQQGVELIDKEPKIGTGGKRIAFVHPHSTAGVLIELYEKSPDEKKPPLVDLEDLRERFFIEAQTARAGLEGFLSALQKRGTAAKKESPPPGNSGKTDDES